MGADLEPLTMVSMHALPPTTAVRGFHIPLIEPDVRFSRIRLSDGFHTEACAGDPR